MSEMINKDLIPKPEAAAETISNMEFHEHNLIPNNFDAQMTPGRCSPVVTIISPKFENETGNYKVLTRRLS